MNVILPQTFNAVSIVSKKMPAYKWVSLSIGQPMPDSAVAGGHEADGKTIYVGRAYHNGDMVPAKIIPSNNAAYIAYNGEEVFKHEFEVLCRSSFVWEFASNGAIPEGAVVAGQTAESEPLYVGRFLHKGAQTIGKVQASHGCLYVAYDGEELSFRDYEVLVCQ